MTRRPLPARRSRGMAVITALLVVMVATTLVAGLLQRQSTDVRALENALARSQARQLIQAGLDWARAVLASDARRFAVTTPEQLWAVPVEDTRLNQGEGDRTAVFSGRIEDAQGKFNLANLAADGEPDMLRVAAFQRLLAFSNLPPNLAEPIAAHIAMAQPRTTTDGTRPALVPRPASLDELRVIEGVTPEVIAALGAIAVMLPIATGVNVNTASPEVMAATIPGLSLPAARTLMAQRDRGAYFNNVGDLQNRLPEGTELADNGFVVNSNWFLIKGVITYERAVISTTALVRRGDTASPEVLWIRESL